MDDPHVTLRRIFGHADFRPGQLAVVEALLAGRSALAIFPTGAGKSLCYQLPAIMLDGTAVVISPLIALMKDQVEALQARGVAAARYDSSLPPEEAAKVMADMRNGQLKLLYIAPERLINESFIERLRKVRVSLLAIDEAHCISEWGHNFRPEYLRLASVAKELNLHPVLALTATATPEVAKDIRRAFDVAEADHVQTPFHRPNLHLRIAPCPANQRLAHLTHRLAKRPGAPSVVYVTLQHTSEEVATHLAKQGIKARAYHAGLGDECRSEVQDGFMRGVIDVIVATIAFGMGIDKADIRAVYHYNLPKTLENYQQEIGRAGRDGNPALCELLACEDDRIVLGNFTYGDTPTDAALKMAIDHLFRQGEEFDLSRYDLSVSTDIRQLVLETIITYLELDGLIKPLGSFYSSYQFRFLQPMERVLQGHTPQRQAFLRRLFQAGKQGRTWITLNPDEAATGLGEPRDRVLKALTWLEEASEIELRPSGVRHRFRLLGRPEDRDLNQIVRRMKTLFAERETRDAERLAKVLDYAAHPGCLTRYLLRYFGEDLAGDCGHCSSCDAAAKGQALTQARNIPRPPSLPITTDHVAAIRNLMAERHASLRSPRQLARFLCGLTSPATTRERLGRHDAFGLLERVPFHEVLAQTESMAGRQSPDETGPS